MLKQQIKIIAQKQKRHPNSVWAELKKKYKFYSYKEIDCKTLEQIKKDISK